MAVAVVLQIHIWLTVVRPKCCSMMYSGLTSWDNFLQVKELSLLVLSTNLTHKGFTSV